MQSIDFLHLQVLKINKTFVSLTINPTSFVLASIDWKWVEIVHLLTKKEAFLKTSTFQLITRLVAQKGLLFGSLWSLVLSSNQLKKLLGFEFNSWSIIRKFIRKV